MTLTPAAVAALLRGEIENLHAASTPGGIEAQEAAGQAILSSDNNRLPLRIIPTKITHAMIEAAWGVKFGAPVEDIFIETAFPEGWKIVPTAHNMWSDLIDDKGSRRAGVFYKAAFYDRKAHLTINRRYEVNITYQTSPQYYSIVDNKLGKEIYYLGKAGERDFQTQDALINDGEEWLKKNYPDYTNPLAYWNEV